MTAFFAIVKLTLRNALRSHIFQLLLALLVICAVALPMTVSGSGEEARSYIQVALNYSLGAIGFILALSTVWLASLEMTQDMETYQLHMVVSKPISRVAVFWAKYTGVVLLHVILLALAGMTVFGLVLWNFSHSKISKEEKERIANTVLVGRRIYCAKAPDMDKLVQERVTQQMEEMKKLGRVKLKDNAPDLESEIRKSINQNILRQQSEVLFGKYGEWEFTDLPKDDKNPVYLRYRFYVGKVDSEEQRNSQGVWGGEFNVRSPEAVEEGGASAQEDTTKIWEQLGGAEQNYGGEFHEKTLPAELIAEDGSVKLRYVNLDPEQEKVYFQSADGPRLLIRETGFFGNFVRGLLVMLVMLLVYAGISCTAASAFSMPTAIFTVLSYMFFGSIAPVIMTTDMLADPTKYSGYWVSRGIQLVVIPLQDFMIADKLADGELVEFDYLLSLGTLNFIVRSLVFALLLVLGIVLYWRRELGLVTRK